MKDDIFYRLEKEVLIVGIEEAYKNACNLYKSAIKLSAEQQYGVANSLLILSVEECVKCLVFVALFCGVKIPVDIKKLLSRHKIKHEEAKKMQSLINDIYIIKDAISVALNNSKSTFDKLISFGILTALAVRGTKAKSENFARWWDNADRQKQKGFYVDFANGKWSIPSSIKQKDYEQTLMIVRPFIESLENVKHIKVEEIKSLGLTEIFEFNNRIQE